MPRYTDNRDQYIADLEEEAEADFEREQIEQQLADEARDLEDEEPDSLALTPVRCIVYGHDLHPMTFHCRRCGQ